MQCQCLYNQKIIIISRSTYVNLHPICIQSWCCWLWMMMMMIKKIREFADLLSRSVALLYHCSRRRWLNLLLWSKINQKMEWRWSLRNQQQEKREKKINFILLFRPYSPSFYPTAGFIRFLSVGGLYKSSIMYM